MSLNPRKLTANEKLAYEIVEGAFMSMLQVAVVKNANPNDLLEPYIQKCAALIATVKMRGGKTDIDDICNKLKIETNASIKQILGDRPSLS